MIKKKCLFWPFFLIVEGISKESGENIEIKRKPHPNYKRRLPQYFRRTEENLQQITIKFEGKSGEEWKNN